MQLSGGLGQKSVARAAIGAVTLTVSFAAVAVTAPAANAVGSGVAQSTVVNAVPSTASPNVTSGVVYAVGQAGSQIVLGGSFTTAQNANSSTTLTRNYTLAFDPSTGTISSGFAPTLDGTVRSVAAGPAANTVFVGGAFNKVNGVASKGLALLNVTTGAPVAGFKVPTLNGVVYSMALVGNRLLLAGSFTKANGIAHGGLLAVNATTGAIDPFMNIQTAGHHNYNGSSGANGAVGPRAMAVSPDGTRAVVIGNFKTADGLPRDQIALIDLDGNQATVDPNWATGQYTAACFSNAFDTYMTDVQYSPDGSYFVVTATGGSGTNTDGSRSLCDTASRWESSVQGPDVHPTWVDYTGQDSLWATAVSGSAVYVSGHERWLNNDNGFDYAGAGAVPRPGLAALDPVSGVPLTWNPGRSPRGAGAYALFLNSAGLYVGSDTNYIGNRKYLRERIAYFTVKGGVAPASTSTAQLPSNMYLAGPLGTNTSNVLYRVDAGGPTIAASDNGPDWMADQSSSDPGAAYHDNGGNTAGYACCATESNAVPSTTPVGIFNTERWDPGSKNDGSEMHWSFPVPAGTHVAVRLYFANRYSGTSQPGQRVFDVAVDGSQVLPNYDIVADVGDQVGTMKSYTVTSPGNVTIDFTHEVENPLINGVELINLDAPSNGAVGPDDLAYRSINGSTIGDLTVVPNTGTAWGSTRGAFMVGSYLYWPSTNGSFYRATFNGTTVGTVQTVDPYHDPAWDTIQTGSGQTYDSSPPAYYSEMPQITGEFYSAGRIYYTLSGQSSLYWRWFSPDSGIVGASEHSNPAPTLSNVAGMTLSGSTLYYASASDGSLHSVTFANGVPSGADTVVSSPATDGRDWRARSLFLYGKPTAANNPPTAVMATPSCAGLNCSFDGSGSSDPDNDSLTYSWAFGDGSTGTGVTTSHVYAKAGTYSVTLTVNDGRGGSDTAGKSVSPSGTAATIAADGANSFSSPSTNVQNPAVAVPGQPGDTVLLFLGVNAAGLANTVPAGWTQVAQFTNSTLQTTVYRHVVAAGDPANVTVHLDAAARVDLQALAYAGVANTDPPHATGTDVNTNVHTTPTATGANSGAWAVSYWSDRTSAGQETWALPAGVTSRQIDAPASGSGRVDSAVADQPVSGSSYGAKTATVTATGGGVAGRGTTVTVLLNPATN